VKFPRLEIIQDLKPNLDECLDGPGSFLEPDNFGLYMLMFDVSGVVVLTFVNCSWTCGANVFSFDLHTLN
jgi:hypothetical protein